MLLLPGETDLYFRVADNAAEVQHLAKGELKAIPSIWGHRAGNPSTNPQDTDFLKREVRAWLEGWVPPLVPAKAGIQIYKERA